MSKKFLFIIFTLITYVLVINTYALQSKRQFKGIGFEALDYEKQSGFPVNPSAYLLLDSIVEKCQSKLTLKENYSYEEATHILNLIGNVIQEFDIKYDKLKLFSEGLNNKKFDCKFNTLTYLTVGENLSLPLFSMFAPEHVFFYWKDNKNEIYWESTTHEQISIQYLIDSLNIPQEAIITNCYLKPLNYNQSRSLIFSNTGLAKSDLGDKQGAILDYDKAIELNPNDVWAYNNRGNAKSDLGDKQGAILDYDKALEFDPKDAGTYNNRGIAKSVLGDKQGAILDYNKALELNPKLPEAYSHRGLIKSDLGDKQGAILDYDKALELNPKLIQVYSNRAAAKENLCNKVGATQDYDKAIELNPKDAGTFYNRGVFKFN